MAYFCQSGAFDVPKEKCPPDGGSLDCVTGSPASIFSNDSGSISSSPESTPFSKSIIYPSSSAPITTISYSKFPSTGSSPRTIPHRNGSHNSYSSTPPLTPDRGSDFNTKTQSHIYPKRERDALDFLMTVFPHQGFDALPYAKGVSISAPSLGADFDGVVLELPGKPKILYVDGKSAATVDLRERYALSLIQPTWLTALSFQHCCVVGTSR